MPNWCDATLRVKGRYEDILMLAGYLKADYQYSDSSYEVFLQSEDKKMPLKHHLGYRVYDVSLVDKKEVSENVMQAEIVFTCAWSVWSSMFDGPFTYIGDNRKEHIKLYGLDPAISLCEACKELRLSAEIFSAESGCAFSEHYIIDESGNIVKQFTANYEELWDGDRERYKTFEEFKADYSSTEMTEADFKEYISSSADYYVKCSHLNDPYDKDSYKWEEFK